MSKSLEQAIIDNPGVAPYVLSEFYQTEAEIAYSLTPAYEVERLAAAAKENEIQEMLLEGDA